MHLGASWFPNSVAWAENMFLIYFIYMIPSYNIHNMTVKHPIYLMVSYLCGNITYLMMVLKKHLHLARLRRNLRWVLLSVTALFEL